MFTLEDAIKQLSLECQEDEVGLWELVRTAKQLTKQTGVKSDTLTIARGLIADPEIRVGQWDSQQRLFQVWEMPAEVIIEELSRKWDQQPTEPSLGDIAWFACVRLRGLPTSI